MSERRQQWLNEKPSADWGNELRFQEGDLIFFRFVGSGNDGDQFIKLWRAHEFEITLRNGRPGATHRYCPIQNGENTDCPYCTQGHVASKERMSIWMYVTNIMHTTMPPEKQYPRVTYQSREYFNEEVNAFRIWHASAWRDSPWGDIENIAEMYKGLHAFTAQMQVIGRELQRRYKVYALPNSEVMTPELYEQAKSECTPILEILKSQMATPVQQAPATQTAGQITAPPPPWAPPGPPPPAWQPPAAAPPNNQAPQEIAVAPEEDPRRPLRSLF